VVLAVLLGGDPFRQQCAEDVGFEALAERFQARLHPLYRPVVEAHAEHRIDDDLHREASHLGVDEDLVAVGPPADHRFGVVGHHTRQAADPAHVEGRLGAAALAPPEVALAQQKPIAQQLPDVVIAERGLAVFALVGYEHALDVGRVREHVGRLAADR